MEKSRRIVVNGGRNLRESLIDLTPASVILSQLEINNQVTYCFRYLPIEFKTETSKRSQISKTVTEICQSSISYIWTAINY